MLEMTRSRTVSSGTGTAVPQSGESNMSWREGLALILNKYWPDARFLPCSRGSKVLLYLRHNAPFASSRAIFFQPQIDRSTGVSC